MEIEQPSRQEWLLAVMNFQFYCFTMGFSEDSDKATMLTMNDFLPGSIPLKSSEEIALENETPEQRRQRAQKVSRSILGALKSASSGSDRSSAKKPATVTRPARNANTIQKPRGHK